MDNWQGRGTATRAFSFPDPLIQEALGTRMQLDYLTSKVACCWPFFEQNFVHPCFLIMLINATVEIFARMLWLVPWCCQLSPWQLRGSTAL